MYHRYTGIIVDHHKNTFGKFEMFMKQPIEDSLYK